MSSSEPIIYEVLAKETMSAILFEKKMAMSLGLIGPKRITTIQTGGK